MASLLGADTAGRRVRRARWLYDHVPPPGRTEGGCLTGDDLRRPGAGVRASSWVAARSVFGHDGQNGQPEVHFDHTSLLATIVRRFLPSSPPAMGGRYAVAEDLSHALAPTRRAVTGRLRPFCRTDHLDVDGGGTLGPLTTIMAWRCAAAARPGPGTPDPHDPQAFCLEDRPDGTFRIRSRVGRLYWPGSGLSPALAALPYAVGQ